MEGPASDRSILEWDETDVHNWLSFLGYPHYEAQIRGQLAQTATGLVLTAMTENHIRGDTLCSITSDDLRSLGISAIGQRLSILKAIYLVKLAHSIPLEEDDYVPPCENILVYRRPLTHHSAAELAERPPHVTVDKLHVLLRDQGKSTQLCW